MLHTTVKMRQTMRETLHRRTILKTVGTAAITTAIAGCSGSSGNDGSDADSADSNSGGDSSGSESVDQFLASEPSYGGWFDNVDNYEQTGDLTGQETVTISVGAGENGLLFDPPAVAVDPGTTIRWKWTGEGGLHNVAAESGAFESDTVGEAGHTFEQTFSETEIIKYVCTPHRALGMKGAVVVQEQ